MKFHPRMVVLKNGETLLIREVDVSDAKRVVEYMKTVTAETVFNITAPDEVFDVSTEKKLIKMFRENPRDLMIVGELRGEIVSILSLRGFTRKRTSHAGEMSISVKKKYWGIGIGTAMMKAMIEWAKREGFERIQLEVFKSNERAINLYKKMGFVEEGLKRRAVRLEDGRYEDVLVMALLLD